MKDNIPCSKSYAQRYILIALFSKSKVTLHGIEKDNVSDDVKSAIRLLDRLSVSYNWKNDVLFIDASTWDDSVLDVGFEFNCGESGTLLRMLVPILANYKGTFTLTGEGSLLNRKVDSIKDTFSMLGIEFKSSDGRIPIKVCGKNRKLVKETRGSGTSELFLDGKETSQYISGMIIAACLRNEAMLVDIGNCPSLEYLKITTDALWDLDFSTAWANDHLLHIFVQRSNENRRYVNLEIDVEKDWSSGAAWIVNKVVNRTDEFYVKGLIFDSLQCDRKILQLMSKWYVVDHAADMIIFRRIFDLASFEFDCTECPDLFPVVCALAATISGTSKITGVDRLVNKESDRGKVMLEELKKLGFNAYIKDNSLYIEGDMYRDHISVEKLDTYDSHNDHRIAMAMLMIRYFNYMKIPKEDKCLDKSYPRFIEDLRYEY